MKSKQKHIQYGPQFKGYGERHMRWIENVSAGLRFVGHADDLVRSIRHKGWYADNFQDETYRGCVYQLPARHGVPQFVGGYSDPNNDDCALLSFYLYDEKEDAARAADLIAEARADEQRQYNEAWQAGSEYADLKTEISSNRRALIELIRERKELCRLVCGTSVEHTAHAVLKEIRRLLQAVRDAQRKRADLYAHYANTEGFKEHV